MNPDFLARIEPLRQAVEEHLAANLKTSQPLVQEVGRHILLSGGKRLRPILFLLSARLCGRDQAQDAHFSSIFEFLHCASLLHDDVVDSSATRRGRPAAHQLWDAHAAVMVGDHLFARSLALAAETGRLEVITTLADCISRLAEGQILERAGLGRFELGREVYLEVITAKTAALLAASARVGAILAQAGPEREEALHAFGLDLGLAFQIIDDVLDWSGSAEVVGKPVGQDLREGKATLPWLKALEAAPAETRREMLHLAGQPDLSPAEFEALRDQVSRLGGPEAALKEAEAYKERAKSRLNIFPDSPPRRLLRDLADYVCRRRL